MSVSVLTKITHITQSYSPREELNGFRRPVRSLLVVDDVTYCSACECSSNLYTGSRCKSQVGCKVFHSHQNYQKVTALNSKTTISPGINYQLMLAEATYICMNETQHDIHYPPAYGSQSFLNPFNLRWYTSSNWADQDGLQDQLLPCQMLTY